MIPQCTKRWQLYEQMSRVLKMCEEAGFDRPLECLRIAGVKWTLDRLPILSDDPTTYEFALAIVEGRPVFRGNVLYDADGTEFIVENGWNDRYLYWSWNPPQRTIEINGVEVKAPLTIESSEDAGHPERHGVFITFKYHEDAEAFKAAMEGK